MAMGSGTEPHRQVAYAGSPDFSELPFRLVGLSAAEQVATVRLVAHPRSKQPSA